MSIKEQKQKGYGIGVLMFTLISQYEVTERFGAVAMFYNRLYEKERDFAKKRDQYSLKVIAAKKRHKPIPKCPLALHNYDTAVRAAIKSWDEALGAVQSKTYLEISGVFIGFWHKEKEILSRLYGFKDEDFKALDESSGYLFSTKFRKPSPLRAGI